MAMTFEEYWHQSTDGIRKDGLYTMEQVRDLVRLAFLASDATDEIDRLREALRSYASCSDGCTCGDGWSHDVAREALTVPNGRN